MGRALHCMPCLTDASGSYFLKASGRTGCHAPWVKTLVQIRGSCGRSKIAAADTNPKRQRGHAMGRGLHCMPCLAEASGSYFLKASGRTGCHAPWVPCMHLGSAPWVPCTLGQNTRKNTRFYGVPRRQGPPAIASQVAATGAHHVREPTTCHAPSVGIPRKTHGFDGRFRTAGRCSAIAGFAPGSPARCHAPAMKTQVKKQVFHKTLAGRGEPILAVVLRSPLAIFWPRRSGCVGRR